MSRIENYTFRSHDDDNTAIHCTRWLPDSDKPKAVLQLVHGMVEYIERYSDFAEFLTRNGFVVAGHDHIGHGQSVKSHEDWGIMHTDAPDDVMVEDIYEHYLMIRDQYPDLPHFILGHSMGSYMVRKFLAAKSGDLHDLSGAIIMGTGTISDGMTSLALTIIGTAARFRGWNHRSPIVTSLMFGSSYKKFDMTGEDPDNSWLSKNVANVKKYYADPKCTFMFSLNGYRGLVNAVRFDNQMSNIGLMNKDTPILFVSGADDPVGDFGKGVNIAYGMFKRAGMTDVHKKLYDNDRHEILNETDRHDVYKDLLKWMDARA